MPLLLIDIRLYDLLLELSQLRLLLGPDVPVPALFVFVLNHDKPNTNPNQKCMQTSMLSMFQCPNRQYLQYSLTLFDGKAIERPQVLSSC